MEKLVLGILAICAASAALGAADTANTPTVRVGDTWIYRDTEEKGTSGWNQTRDEVTVSRVTSSSIYFATKPTGSSQAPKLSLIHI